MRYASLQELVAVAEALHLGYSEKIDNDSVKKIVVTAKRAVGCAAVPKSVLNKKQSDAFCYYLNGYDSFREGRVDDAIACFEKSVGLDPNWAYTYIALAGLLETKGKQDEAYRHYKIAADLSIAHLEAQFKECERTLRSAKPQLYSGLALNATDWRVEAVSECKKALELDPKDFMAYFRLGLAFARQGLLHEAIECEQLYNQMTKSKAQPAKPEPAEMKQKSPLELNLGMALKDLGEHLSSPTYYHNVGIALYKLNRIDDAISYFTKAVELGPKLPWYRVSLGYALHSQGNLELADRTLRTAINIDPKDDYAHNILGNVLREQGKLDEAIKHYKIAAGLGSKYAKKCLAEMEAKK